MRVLLVSVGGSDVPVVKAIEKSRAEYVYFICSEDNAPKKNGSWRTVEGKIDPQLCKLCSGELQPAKDALVEQAGLKPEQYTIVRVNSDEVYDVYEKVSNLIVKHLEQRDAVTVDYTGGTKSMSAGCAAAAMDHPDCRMSVVIGERVDMVKVRDGMEKFQKVMGTNKVFIRRKQELAVSLFAQRDYVGAGLALEELCENGGDCQQDKWLVLCRALAAWDNFQWETAKALLRNYDQQAEVKELLGQIGLICIGLDWFEGKEKKDKTPPKKEKAKEKPRAADYAPVYDLLLNAERRAEAGAYDDAMARVYRAVEMYAQFSLKNHTPALSSSDLKVELLPLELQGRYESLRAGDGKVKFGLEKSYDLLAELGHPVGQVWGRAEDKRQRSWVLEMMKKRNYSFLAHGMAPMSKADWLQVKEIVWRFIHKGDEAMGVRVPLAKVSQLPNELRKFVFVP